MKTSELSLESLPPRERILGAAHALFYGEGIRATGIDKIIERSSVSKVTFYRQYASKDDLIRAYLDYRHEKWIAWFQGSLAQAQAAGASAVSALVTTLRSWFSQPDFRGCAFLNAAAELGSSDPEILAVVRRHKQQMSAVLDKVFRGEAVPAGRALALVVDGAIVHAQMGHPVDDVMKDFHAVVMSNLPVPPAQDADGHGRRQRPPA